MALIAVVPPAESLRPSIDPALRSAQPILALAVTSSDEVMGAAWR
jgi:hypothetical protein